jgi:prolyl oligopeptidase
MRHRPAALLLAAAWLTACAGHGAPAAATTAAPPRAATASTAPAAAAAPAIPATAALAPAPPPPTPQRPVEDTYHGVSVRDPYRWLEDSGSPDVKAWTEAQDARARRFLDALPGRGALAARVRELLTAPTVRWSDLRWQRGRLFALRREPTQQQPALVTLPSPDAPEGAKVVVDPASIDPGGHVTIDLYRPSPDGRIVAVSLSRGGTESGDVHFFEAETAREVFEPLLRVHGGTAGGDLAWAADGKAVFYTRYPRPGERPPVDVDFYTQVFSHRLGTPQAQDRYEVGKEFPKTAEIALEAQDGTGRVLATVQEGDSGRFRHWLRDRDGRWRRLTDWGDGISGSAFGPRDELFLLSRKGAPRGRILRVALPDARLDRAKVIVPEGEAAIDWSFEFGPDLVVSGSRLWATYQLGGPSELRAFDLDGRPQAVPRQPEGSTVRGTTRYAGGEVLFARQSFTEAPGWWRAAVGAPEPSRTPLASRYPVDFSDAETRREWAVSKDGTRVPITIVLRRGTPLDGTAPCLATGYGGYGLSSVPRFDPLLRVWLDRGGVSATVHVRGGGEFGEAWHAGGSGLAKQNTFDDFAAALRLLADKGYTRPERLAIEGGSNGGILMGAILTQHPGLVAAVVSHVGVYDMLRSELTPNGQFNVPEYGSVKDPAQFRVLYGYSPYHHVEPGTPYPAVLLLTGANDPRVEPWHSKKLAAALQADSTSRRPVLLRVEFQGGHGIGASLEQRIGQDADVYAFVLWALGVGPGPAATSAGTAPASTR